MLSQITALISVLLKAVPILLEKKPLFDELVASVKAIFIKHNEPDVAADLTAVLKAGADADARRKRLEDEK